MKIDLPTGRTEQIVSEHPEQGTHEKNETEEKKMAKLTKAQYEKWNGQAKGGFRFDLEYFLTWGEKQLVKNVEIENGNYIRFTICFSRELEKITNEYGCSYQRETGRVVPNLHVSIWRPSPSGNPGVYVASGLGEWEEVGAPEKTKKYSVLCKLSEALDLSKYLAGHAVA